MAELPFEFMLNALRLQEGFTLAAFERATGLPATTILPKLGTLVSRGLMIESEGRYRPTELGFRFLNDLQAGFLTEETGGLRGGELYTAPSGLVPQRDFRHIVREVP